jgi:endonuclease/exonuclease/phosphatase family metal-dependent hydrolase
MRARARGAVFALAVAAAAACVRATPASGPLTRVEPHGLPLGAVRVMSFNIRYGTAPDGPNAWPLRRPLALRVIRDFSPAVLGLQEALRAQLDDIARALPWLGEVGVGRNDGAQAGEYAAILYDRHQLTLLAQGWFWLSDTPEVPASMTWGNRYPRIVTWARFAHRVTGQAFSAFNTHWDHESQLARENSARLLLERIAARPVPDEPVVLMGDLNCDERNPAFAALAAGEFTDAFRTIRPSATSGIGTFHGFRGGRQGTKIDFVLVSPLHAAALPAAEPGGKGGSAWQVLDADIVRTSEGRRYPSDHFPVTATLLISTSEPIR